MRHGGCCVGKAAPTFRFRGLRTVLAGAALACLGASAAWAGALEKPKVTLAVGGKATLYYLPLTLAERLGYFRDEGLSVEISDFPGGAKALQAVVGGSADVVSGGYEHTIQMQAKGQKLQAFVLQGNAGLALGLIKGRIGAYAGPADLKGRTIGVTAPGSSTHMLVNHLLGTVGLKADDVAVIGVGTGATAVAAARGGQLDALSTIEPALTMLEKSGDLRIVHETMSETGAKSVFGGAMPSACLYARQSFVQENPNTVQALTNAVVRALRWLQRASAEEVAKTVPPEYLLGDRAVYVAAVERLRPVYARDGTISKSGAELAYRVTAAHDPAVRGAASIRLDQTYTNAFAEKAASRPR